jgi:quercetin dioxygenase-like cupin family protein
MPRTRPNSSCLRRPIAAAFLLASLPLAATTTGANKPAAVAPAIDANVFPTMIQSLDKVRKEEYPWGWIRWLMSAKASPGAEMTFGMVEINAGHSNPAHVHPNCEEQIYILSGSCEQIVGKQSVTLKAGDAMRIPRGVPHKARTGKEPVRAIIVYSSGDRQFQSAE